MDPMTISMLMQMFGGGGGGGSSIMSSLLSRFGGGQQGGQQQGGQQQGGNPFSSSFSSPVTNIASGLMNLFGGGGGDPYKKGFHQYSKYMNQAADYQKPFYNAGVQGLGKYQDWLGKMEDPTKFINNISGQYQESPFAKILQDRSMRAFQNQGSASGLSGSTPLTQFAQQNAHDISSQDQNQWMQNILGANSQYGQGQQYLTGVGQNASNSLSEIMRMMADAGGGQAYNSSARENSGWGDIFKGLFG